MFDSRHHTLQVNDCKEQVGAKGEELHMMIMCYKVEYLSVWATIIGFLDRTLNKPSNV